MRPLVSSSRIPLDGYLHCRQSFVISEFPLAVLAPITLDAVKSAEFHYVWRTTVFTGSVVHTTPLALLPFDTML
jgi:hypothetical protein